MSRWPCVIASEHDHATHYEALRHDAMERHGAVVCHGLGVLVRLHRQLDERLGEIKIASASGSIVNILRRTRLAKLFKIYPDVQSARQAFKKVKKPPLICR